MDESEGNRLLLTASIESLEALRRTPAGVAAVNCTLRHESSQIEAGQPRTVRVELPAVALGEQAHVLAAARPGMQVNVTGFIAAKSLRSRIPVLHLTTIEFLEGYENGVQAQIQVQEA